jgi:signal transduction histidine kinase
MPAADSRASNAPTDELTALREQLAQARRLSALGELTSTTTHEFNNVLMTIINYAKLGLRQRDQPSRDKAFEKILAASQRAAKITNGILGLARNRADRQEPADLAQLADDTLLLLERELSKYRISVERHFQPVPPALVHPNQIQQVLVNLLINARQAMPQGGRVILKLDYDAATGLVEFVVRDTGCGMAPETMRRIFDPFFSTKTGPDATGRGGTGLGLATCREIVEAHHGRIRVESTLGKGTAFTIMLPAAQAADAAPTAALPSVATGARAETA